MKQVAIILILTVFYFTSLFANEEKTSVQKRADFILKMAENISYSNTSDNKEYKIGIFGNRRDIKELFKELKSRVENIKIQNRTVTVFLFRRLRHVKPVDLLYITGDSRIRLSNLNKKLEGRPHIILTENFPFGISALNFSMNKNRELFFEIREDYFKDRGAKINQRVLKSKQRVDKESTWEKKLDAALVIIEEKEKKIEAKELTIQKKTQEIEQQDKVIGNLHIIIFIVGLSLLIISTLVAILLYINKQRKIGLKKITDSINYAKHIQDSILKKDVEYEDYIKDCFILYKPKDIVSGDFYWITHEDNKLFFMVADCTGHGVPGAMLSLICYNSLKKAIKELKIYEPAKILDKTTIILEDILPKEGEIKDGMDLALCCFHLDSNILEFAGANNPLYYIRNNELLKIKSDRQTVDTRALREPYTNNVIEYKKEDVFYLFSDGYADQFGGENDKKFLYSRFRNVLLENHKKTMAEQKDILLSNFEKWKGKHEQVDDVCVMGIQI